MTDEDLREIGHGSGWRSPNPQTVWISLSDFDPPRPHPSVQAGQLGQFAQLGAWSPNALLQQGLQQTPAQQQIAFQTAWLSLGSGFSGAVPVPPGGSIQMISGLASSGLGQSINADLYPDQRQDIEVYAADIEAGYLARYSDGNPCPPPPSGSLQHALWMLGWRTADRERRRRMATAPDLAGTVADAAEAWIGVEDMPDGSVTWHARVRVPEET